MVAESVPSGAQLLIDWFEEHFVCDLGLQGPYCDKDQQTAYRSLAAIVTQRDGETEQESAVRCATEMRRRLDEFLAMHKYLAGTKLFWRMRDKVQVEIQQSFETAEWLVLLFTRVAIPDSRREIWPFEKPEGASVERV